MEKTVLCALFTMGTGCRSLKLAHTCDHTVYYIISGTVRGFRKSITYFVPPSQNLFLLCPHELSRFPNNKAHRIFSKNFKGADRIHVVVISYFCFTAKLAVVQLVEHASLSLEVDSFNSFGSSIYGSGGKHSWTESGFPFVIMALQKALNAFAFSRLYPKAQKGVFSYTFYLQCLPIEILFPCFSDKIQPDDAPTRLPVVNDNPSVRCLCWEYNTLVCWD